MLWVRSHTKYAVNNGQLSSMNVLQVVCQKPHGAKPMASPINNSFTGGEFSGSKLTNRWNLRSLLLPLLPSSLMLRKNCQESSEGLFIVPKKKIKELTAPPKYLL